MFPERTFTQRCKGFGHGLLVASFFVPQVFGLMVWDAFKHPHLRGSRISLLFPATVIGLAIASLIIMYCWPVTILPVLYALFGLLPTLVLIAQPVGKILNFRFREGSTMDYFCLALAQEWWGLKQVLKNYRKHLKHLRERPFDGWMS